MKDVEGDLKKLKVGLESEKRLEEKRVNFNAVGICDLTCWLKVVGCKIAVGYGALPLATLRTYESSVRIRMPEYHSHFIL